MKFLNRKLIRDCLHELSDESYQRRIWTGSSGPEISSLTEATCQLFDDSALDLAFEKGLVFGEPVDEMLKELGTRLVEISDNRPPLDVINDPKMVAIRQLSAQIRDLLPES